MASRPQRTVVRAEAPAASAAKSRMSAWDQVSSAELAFDFKARSPEAKAPALDWGSRDRASVKEAIIRWLEEQL